MDNSDWPGLGDHADRAVLILLCYRLAPQHWPMATLVLVTWSCFVVRVLAATRKIDSAASEELLPYIRS
jgi:hypothetical protein